MTDPPAPPAAPTTVDAMLAFVDGLEDGWCSAPQPQLLYEYAARVEGRGAIVEVGSFGGKSTIAMAFAQKERGGQPVHAFDMAKHPRFDGNVALAGVEDYVRFTEASSSQAGRRWQGPIELLWIDGGHDHACVLRDIELWTPHVIPGGWALFHDYPGMPDRELGPVGRLVQDGVARALQRTLLREPWEWRVVTDREVGSIIGFQRLDLSFKPSASKAVTRLYYGWRDLKFRVQDRLRGR